MYTIRQSWMYEIYFIFFHIIYLINGSKSDDKRLEKISNKYVSIYK
jgi:hypothetical protein